MQGNSWYYSTSQNQGVGGYNIYNPPDQGDSDNYLPNCTCYAFGRFAEIRGSFTGLSTKLPFGDAQSWWSNATDLTKSQTPQTGAIAVWSGNGTGHVAIVERVYEENGVTKIDLSESAFDSQIHNNPFPITLHNEFPYFTYDTGHTQTPISGYAEWAGTYLSNNYTFLGFIYNDYEAISVSDYVIAAIAGVWNLESGLNPDIWESLKIPSVDLGWQGSNWEYEFYWNPIELEGYGGYGLGAWTNVDTHQGFLYNMSEYARTHGYQVTDRTVDVNGQLDAFVNMPNWASGSNYLIYGYQTLSEFLSSSETNLHNLVTEFFVGWESGGNSDPSDPDWGVDKRQYSADLAYDYIQHHKNDDPNTYSWYRSNEYIANFPDSGNPQTDHLSARTYNNLMCMYFWFQGYSPSPEPPTPPTPTTRRGMPLWMMLRYY